MDHFDPDAFQRIHDSGEQLVSVHLNVEKPVLHNDIRSTEKTELRLNWQKKFPGLRMLIILKADLLSPWIPYSMQVLIMCRKHPECLFRLL